MPNLSERPVVRCERCVCDEWERATSGPLHQGMSPSSRLRNQEYDKLRHGDLLHFLQAREQCSARLPGAPVWSFPASRCQPEHLANNSETVFHQPSSTPETLFRSTAMPRRRRRATDSEHDYHSHSANYDDESYHRNRRAFRRFARRIPPTPLPEYRASRILSKNNVPITR